MTVYLSPVNGPFVDANGNPLSGGKINTYQAGTSTPLATYTSNDGLTQQSNPIILNTLGLPSSPIWLTASSNYKFVVTTSTDAAHQTIDNISGINDVSAASSEWNESGLIPTYISTTSFSVPGDQTSTLHVNRRIRTRNTSGYVYSRISASVYTSITTVTVVNDSTPLDSGLSLVAYGFLSYSPSSVPYGLYAETGANSTITKLSGITDYTGSLAFRGYLSGCILSTAGSSATMSISAGVAMDSTNTMLMQLAAIAKTTSAWAVGTGNGGIDTGAIANNTWYHFYVIRRPDTGVVDVVFSTSASSPTLPTNYTQYRRIGSGKTNGSAQWTKFTQDGDYFVWDAAPLDVNTTNPGTSSVTATLSVPTGVNVLADVNVVLKQTATITFGYLRDLAVTDIAPSSTAAPLANFGSDTVGGAVVINQLRVRTNTSAQVGYRMNTSDASVIVRIATNGWTDTRGKNA